jgi:hypothetical protein
MRRSMKFVSHGKMQLKNASSTKSRLPGFSVHPEVFGIPIENWRWEPVPDILKHG